MLEGDLKERFTQKEEGPVRVSYDLLPNGSI